MIRTAEARIHRRLRTAGILLVIGLIAQLATLFWDHPLSFLAFMFLASPLTVAGMVLYLFSIGDHSS